MTGLERLETWSARPQREVSALYLAYRDPRVTRYAKPLVTVVVAYASSPIDLIPDPIPGHLDDLVPSRSAWPRPRA